MPLVENSVKEELSYAYVHAIAARAGFSCDRPHNDRESLDVLVSSHGRVASDSVRLNSQIGLQLKATSTEVLGNSSEFSFSLPMKNYNDLRGPNTIPRLLIVFVMPPDPDLWLKNHEPEDFMVQRRCAYWLDLFGSPEVTNSATRVVSIPRANVLNVHSLTELMAQASRLELGHV